MYFCSNTSFFNGLLKELEEKKKQKLVDIQSTDVLSVNLEETKTSMMAPPRKNKRSPEKKSSTTRPSTEKTTSFEEKLTVHVLEDSAKQLYQQFKTTRIHVTVERDEAEQVKAAVEEQRLIQKVNEKSVSAVREETTPVPSRRKTKALTTDTEPLQYKVETVATAIPDVSKPSIPLPVSKDVAGGLTEKVDETLESSFTKSLTEQARTTAKLGDTSKDAIRPEVSLEITDAKPTPIKDDSEPITKTDAKQRMSVPEISQVITEPTEAADLDGSKLLPKKRKSKSQKPTDEPDSQISLTYKEQAEALPMDKTIIIPSGKSEVLGLSVAPEPVLAAERSSCVVKEPEKPLEIAVSEQIEVLPPKRKSKSPNLPQKHTDQQRKGESDRVEPEDGKKEPDNLKSSSTSQEVSITTETISKISPTKRRSKGATLLPEQDTKEGADTKQEPDSQKPSREPTKDAEETKVMPIRRKSKTLEVFTETEKVSPQDRISFMEPKETTQEAEKDPTVTDIVAETAVVEKSTFIPPRRKPKSSELPLQLAETEVPQTVEDPEGQKVGVATNKVSPTTRKSKGPKVSPDLPHKVETHAMEKPESLITEAAIVEETKVIPSKRKSKENPDSQKPEVVTGPAEMVVEKGKLSPTKRKSKGAKHLTEVVTKDVAEVTKEQDVQKSQTETVIIGTTDAKSTKSREELQSEKATSTAQVVVGVPGSTIVEEVKFLPPTRKSKDPKVSPELPHKDKTQAVEKPVSQETFSISFRSAHNEPEQTKKESESPVVALPVLQISSQQIQEPKTTSQKSELSDIKPRVNKDVKSEITVQVQGSYDVQEYPEKKLSTIIIGTSEVFVIADTHPLKVDTLSHAEPLESRSSTLPKDAVAESQEPKAKSEKAPEQSITKSTDQSKTPETQPHLSSEPTDAPYGADYVDKLWKNTAEIQRRYLLLDMPDIGIRQTCDRKNFNPKPVSDSSQPTSVVCAVAQPHDTEMDVAAISPTEQEIMRLSESLSQLKLTQERHKEDKEQGDKHKKEIIKVSKEKEDEVDFMKESVILCEAVPKSKDATSTNAQLEKTAVKKTVMKMQLSSNEFPDTMAQPTSPASAVSTPDQEGTTVVKEHGVQEQPPTVWTYFMDQPAKTLDEKSLKVEKIHLGPEVCILQLDIETATEEHGNQEPRIEIQTSIRIDEEPENQDKTFADVEPEKAADVMTEKKLQGIRTECQDNVTHRDSAPPTSVVSELLQPYDTETEFIEINLYEQDTVKSSQREIKIEFLKTTQDRTTEVKEQGVKEEHPEPSIHGMDDVTGSLEEKSVKIEKIPMEPQVRVLQLDIPPGLEEHANAFVVKAEEQRTDRVQTQGEKEHMHDARLHELSDGEEKIHKEPEVCVLQPDTEELLKEHEIKCVVIGTVTGIDKHQTSILCEKVLENKDLTFAAAQPKETAVDVPMVEMMEVVKEPDSRITKGSFAVKAKVTSRRRKSKEGPESLKPSSALEVVKGPAEINVVEEGKVSPTKRGSKGPKHLSEVDAKDLAEIVKEPDLQKSLEQTKAVLLIEPRSVSKSSDDTTAVEPGYDSRGSTEVKPQEAKKELESEKVTSTAEIIMGAPETTSPEISQVISPKEETQTKEKPHSQITEATIEEETKVTPKRRKSREDPASQKPSTRDVVTAPTEITVVEKGKMSPTTE